MKLKRPMYGPGHKHGPTRGEDVLVLKNGLMRHPRMEFTRPKTGFDDVFNRKTAAAVADLQELVGIIVSGNVGQPTWNEISPHVDARRRKEYERFVVPGEDPELVEPHQGFESLHPDLWVAYAIGVTKYGLGDGPGLASGTHNPRSTINGAPSSHASWPARAFDLDLPGANIGFRHREGRPYFDELVERREELEVGYVILGGKIWSARRASEGVRPYSPASLHANHIHVNLTV